MTLEAYRAQQLHCHSWTPLGRYEHCVDCGAIRVPVDDDYFVTDETDARRHP